MNKSVLFSLLSLALSLPSISTAENLKEALLNLARSDQKGRYELVEVAKTDGYNSERFKSLWASQRTRDIENMAKLKKILDQHGFPGKSLVGKTASEAAFYVLQHSDIAYQKKYFPLVRNAVDEGELDPMLLAKMEDRILMREDSKQKYGTQLKSNQEGSLELVPIEDQFNVDCRRKQVNLPPINDYLRSNNIEPILVKHDCHE